MRVFGFLVRPEEGVERCYFSAGYLCQTGSGHSFVESRFSWTVGINE